MQNLNTICLVTGCSGFVGSHLTQRLLDRGFYVVGVDNFFSGHRRNMSAFAEHPNFTFFERSIEEANLLLDLKERFSNIQHVFHLAAVVSVPYSIDHSKETMAINCDSTMRLHEFSRKLGLLSFTFAGSAAEYGEDSRIPLAEEYACKKTLQLSPYGQAKYQATAAIEASGFGTSLRFFNIYGPRQDPSSPYSGVISRFISQGLQNASHTIFGDGLQTRDFIHVADAVDAYLLAAGIEGGKVLSGVFNVATGKAVTIKNLAELIANMTGNGQNPTFLQSRTGDIKHSLALVDKINKEGFEPKVSLINGLVETVAWYKENIT